MSSTPDLVTHSARLEIRERLATGPVVVTVKLVASDGEVLAASAVTAESLPTEASVSVDPVLLTSVRGLSWWVFARGEVGSWGTLELASVSTRTPERSSSTDVTLTRLED